MARAEVYATGVQLQIQVSWFRLNALDLGKPCADDSRMEERDPKLRQGREWRDVFVMLAAVKNALGKMEGSASLSLDVEWCTGKVNEIERLLARTCPREEMSKN